MHFLSHRPEFNARWQLYRQLELIPNTVPSPAHAKAPTLGLGWAWHKLIALLIAELEAEDRLEEYFERCWALDLAEEDERSSNSLQKLWALMD